MYADGDNLTIWTIGHSTRTIEQFVELLTANGIELLVDIRRHSGSRKFPQFNPEPLAASLREAGVEYTRIEKLGGRRKVHADSHNTVWRNASFRGYADYMETAEFRCGIDALVSLAERKRTAIMCAEAVWWRCHRSLVADYLKAKGAAVLHILSETSVKEHPFTSAATVVRDTVRYGEAREDKAMSDKKFKVGDHVKWNSEAGHVSGHIIKIHFADFDYKGHTHRADPGHPQYEIKSDKTDHIAAHKPSALTKIDT
ncbi:MAG TPA: HVA1 family protein [Pyrinomonadaceae bacterium]|nr:HVA1 family protein [Pyrinomonadaceae bacterium]